MGKSVLILGCGRSGTSIFGELFDELPDYSYHSEPEFVLLEKMDHQRPVAVKVPRESPGYPPDPGLSFPLSQLKDWFPPSVQIFWQLRHPLDTIASLRVGISRNWGHHPRPPDWKDWLSAPLLARCAHHWNYINVVGYEQVAGQVVITRFEKMLEDPLAFARKACSLVGVDLWAADDAIWKWSRRVQNTNNTDFVEAKTSRPYSTRDHRVRIGRWRENLTEEDLAIIRPIIRDSAERFGYLDWMHES